MTYHRRESNTCSSVLAASEGTRLRPLAQALYGNGRPKQYCTLAGNWSLLGATLRRAAEHAPAARTLVVAAAEHEAMAREDLQRHAPEAELVVQPLRRLLSSLAPVALLGAVAALACSPSTTVGPSALDPHAGLPATLHSVSGLPAVRSLALTVSDLDRSIELFQALDFRLEDQHYLRGNTFAVWAGVQGAEVRIARLELGSEQIELRQFVTPLGRSIAADTRSNDQIFQHMAIVVHDMDEAFSRLQRLPGIELVSGAPQTIPDSNPVAGGIRALYFRDPDHHSLELIWFPQGKGQKRWQSQHAGVFLGIDHSAITVSDTAQSQRFYEGLGFVLAGKSLNYGAEQAALSGVDGARVEITGFAPQAGAGVEFLSYLEPGPGRSAPSDTAVNDLWHWEINLEVADLTAARKAVIEHGGQARAVADVSSFDLGYRFASLVQDRDGHYLQLLQR